MKLKNLGSFKENIRLNKNFKMKGKTIPVITHAVNSKDIFLKILKEGKIDLPSKTKTRKITPIMEKYLGIEDCIYLSGGFTYNGDMHQWPYSFIFKKEIVSEKSIETYKAFLVSQGWLRFLRKLRDEDKEYLLKLRKTRPKLRDLIDSLLEDKSFDWPSVETELGDALGKWSKKEEYLNFIRKFMKLKKLSNSYSPKYIAKDYLLDHNTKKIEIISRKPIELKNKYLLGFYIRGKVSKEINDYLSKNFKGKIIFDGKKIAVIK
jgi:hypothetical protein